MSNLGGGGGGSRVTHVTTAAYGGGRGGMMEGGGGNGHAAERRLDQVLEENRVLESAFQNYRKEVEVHLLRGQSGSEEKRAQILQLQRKVHVCCSVLQCVAECCTGLCAHRTCVRIRHIQRQIATFGHTFVISDVLHYLAALQCDVVCCSVLQRVAACCSVLQRVAVCCSVLQRVAVCCSVLQCVAVSHKHRWLVMFYHTFYALHSIHSFQLHVCCSVVQCVAVCCNNIHSF